MITVVIDDTRRMRQWWIESQEAGRVVRQFTNGEDAMDYLTMKYERGTLREVTRIYLDHDLGRGMNGAQVARMLKTMGWGNWLFIISMNPVGAQNIKDIMPHGIIIADWQRKETFEER